MSIYEAITKRPWRQAAHPGAVVAVLATTALALSACSSGSSSGDASSSNASSTSAPSSNTGSSGTGASKVKLMVITDVASAAVALPQVVTGAQAAVNRINAAGGVNGHQLQLLSCNSQANPNNAAGCAREAVADKVSAVVGLESLESGAAIDILQAADIPSVGSTDLSPQDQTSPVSFPIQSGNIQGIAIVVLTPGWQDCKHPAIMIDSDVPQLVSAAKLMSALFAPPVTAKVVTITTSTVNVQPAVSALLSGGTDCAFLDETQAGTLPTLQAIYASGGKVKTTIAMSVASTAKLKELGAAADNVYGSTYFQIPGTTAAAQAFSTAFTAIDPTGDQDDNALSAYSAVYLFAAAAAHLTDFSPANVLSALNAGKNFATPLMATVAAFPANSGIPGYPRVDMFKFYAYQFSNGEYSLLQPDPVDITQYVKKVIPAS
jgi:ABC-type branched-subunit amino acid transport system substrate-binding protein